MTTSQSQAMAYESERAMFEAYSRNKYVSTGIIQWMLNNAWPSTIWHLFDYYLQPAGGYFGAKRPASLSTCNIPTTNNSIAVVNSRYEKDHRPHRHRETLRRVSPRNDFQKQVKVDVGADGVAESFSYFPRNLSLPPPPPISSQLQLQIQRRKNRQPEFLLALRQKKRLPNGPKTTYRLHARISYEDHRAPIAGKSYRETLSAPQHVATQAPHAPPFATRARKKSQRPSRLPDSSWPFTSKAARSKKSSPYSGTIITSS